MKRTVAYILSTPFAGSHFLSLMLGSHSRTKHVGELNLLLKESSPRALYECRVNRGYFLEGIRPCNITEVYETIFARLGGSTEVLVDTSKRISWAARFLNQPGFERRYIHLIRDPRALVRRYGTRSYYPRRFGHRWKLFREFGLKRPGLLFASAPVLRRYYWLSQNAAITRFLAKNRLEHIVVTYRDLALNPAAEIERVMRWLGLAFEPTQLEYWNFEHIGTEKKAYDWVKEKKEMFIDLRWKSELPPEVLDEIVGDRMIQSYVRSLNLRLVDNGLTRLAETESSAQTVRQLT